LLYYYIHPASGRDVFFNYFAAMLRISIFTITIFLCLHLQAQIEKPLYALNTTKEARAKEYKNLLNNSINKNLLTDLTDSTEENWQNAFEAMELLNYRSAFTDSRIRTAINLLSGRSLDFQKAITALVYSLYPKDFIPQIVSLLKQTDDAKLFAMCSEYIFMNKKTETYKPVLLKRMEEMKQKNGTAIESSFFTVLKNKLLLKAVKYPAVADIMNAAFLPGEMVIYSFQRKNRNYPGLVMVRDKDGKFIKDTGGKYFWVAQLARSGTNMPGYITNGNTPQGIFKIFGFAVSQGGFIGPTTNIQMVLPFEKSGDVADSVTKSLGDNYRSLLPLSWKNYYPFYEAYYAGKVGRTEIIAHGTTVNPENYKKEPYYPLTPTQGCLCTKEIWSTVDGKRMESDQQKLVDAVKKAGGANGYCVVIEINDEQKPVSIKDILLPIAIGIQKIKK
jgi:uncharacterized membrane protein YkvA (DUF1232 family)